MIRVRQSALPACVGSSTIYGNSRLNSPTNLTYYTSNQETNMHNTLANYNDGFALAAEATNNSLNRLSILKHRKGVYEVHGSSGGIIPLNSKFLVLDVMHGWVRIEKGKKIQRVAREAGKHFPD